MMIRLICLDAADTLWHNMRYFNVAEDALLEMLRPFADEHVARPALEACEARNLPLDGDGAKGFTLSMIETAAELCGADLKPTMVADVLATGRSLLAHPVELFEGIAQTLEDLADRGQLVLVTKGDQLHQEAKLAESGLGNRFSGIEIVSDKTAGTSTRLFYRHNVQPAEAVTAGDSMRSDVRPALEVGAWAAYVS